MRWYVQILFLDFIHSSFTWFSVAGENDQRKSIHIFLAIVGRFSKTINTNSLLCIDHQTENPSVHQSPDATTSVACHLVKDQKRGRAASATPPAQSSADTWITRHDNSRAWWGHTSKWRRHKLRAGTLHPRRRGIAARHWHWRRLHLCLRRLECGQRALECTATLALARRPTALVTPRARGESGCIWLAKTIPAFATWVRRVIVLVARILAFSRFGTVKKWVNSRGDTVYGTYISDIDSFPGRRWSFRCAVEDDPV